MNRFAILLVSLSLPACTGRGVADDDLDEPDADTTQEHADSGGSAADAPDPGAPPPGSAPKLPHPSALGLDLEANVLDPRSLTVVAREVRRVRPKIVALELARDLDVTDDPEHPWAHAVTVLGHGPDCAAEGEVLFAFDTRHPQDVVLPDPELHEALVADLTNQLTPACGAKGDAQIAPGGFGPGFWAQDPCDDDWDVWAASGTALTVALMNAIAKVPAWGVACADHIEPVGISYCEGLVGNISTHLTLAQAYQNSATWLVDSMASLTEQAMQIAAAAALGFGGAVNPQDVKALAAIGLKVNAAKAASDSMANLAATNIASARSRAALDPILEAAAGAELSALVATSGPWHASHGVLTTCFRRVTNWIVNAAAIGFGIRFFWPPAGLNIADSGPSDFEDGSTVLYVGPRRVQSTQFFFTDEISIDVDTLSSEHQAMTRREQEPNASYTIYAGYETPGYGNALDADVLGPHPLTLLPIVLAPTGAPVELGDGGYGGPSQYVANTVYTGGTVYLGEAGIDLNLQEVDATGTPLGPLWEQCKVIPQDPLDPHYCGLGVQTTVPPSQIGSSLDRYWRIWTVGGIVDPADGEVIEPEGATFFVSVHATGEGPTSECWVWNPSASAYEQDPTIPGCGIGGDDGAGGSDGGGESGGDGGLPPPPG